jgi:hypothetical protein
MRTSWKLRRVKEQVIKDLKESAVSFAELGKRYGVSKQAIFGFCQEKGIKRPKKDHTHTCSICQSLIRIAKKPHSDFISSRTIKEKLGLVKSKWLYHLRILRKKGLITPKFGRLYSKKMELAFHLYFTKRLSVVAIGKQVELKNLYSANRQHRALGWDVPDPLFTYDSNDRSKAALKRAKKSRQVRI